MHTLFAAVEKTWWSDNFFLGWWTTDRTQVLLNLGLLILASISAFLALRSLRLSRQIEINANRPMMTARVVSPEFHYDVIRFEVANLGKSVAKNVRVKFDPPLPEPNLERARKNCKSIHNPHVPPLARVHALFRDQVFSTWVPGTIASVAYWLPPKDKLTKEGELPRSAEGVPANQDVIITFEDELGNKYSESFELNVRPVIGLDFRQTSAEIVAQNSTNLHKELTKLNLTVSRNLNQYKEAE